MTLLHEVRQLQRRLLAVMTMQEGDPRFAAEAGLLTRILAVTHEQVNCLEDLLGNTDAAGGTPTEDEPVPAVIVEYLRKCEPSRALRVNHTLLELVETRYAMLQTRAREVGHRVAADLALAHLGQIGPFVQQLDRAVRRMAVQELGQGLVQRSAGASILRPANTGDAARWSDSGASAADDLVAR